MKLFECIFLAFCVVAIIAIATGAYWHIYTLILCATLVWSSKTGQKKNK